MMTVTRRATVISVAALMLVFAGNAASAGTVDDCILENTYECLDDADFWGCYDFIVEDCKGQPSVVNLPPARLKAELAGARKQAAVIYKRHLATRN